MKEEIYEKLAQSIIDGEPEDAVAIAKEALDKGLDPLECITNGLTKGIQKVGELFADGEYFLPELIIGADAMKGALVYSRPKSKDAKETQVVKADPPEGEKIEDATPEKEPDADTEEPAPDSDSKPEKSEEPKKDDQEKPKDGE